MTMRSNSGTITAIHNEIRAMLRLADATSLAGSLGRFLRDRRMRRYGRNRGEPHHGIYGCGVRKYRDRLVRLVPGLCAGSGAGAHLARTPIARGLPDRRFYPRTQTRQATDSLI
jgi:hypothetical protein